MTDLEEKTAENEQLKHQIDEMDKYIGRMKAVIVIQAKAIELAQTTNRVVEKATEELCLRVLSGPLDHAQNLASAILHRTSRVRPKQNPPIMETPDSKYGKLEFPPEPEPTPSGIDLPLPSTSTYPAQVPTDSPSMNSPT